MNHERLWTLKNNLRVLEGRAVGGWVSLVVGIREGTYCMEHWVFCINNEFWNTEKKYENKLKNLKRSNAPLEMTGGGLVFYLFIFFF